MEGGSELHMALIEEVLEQFPKDERHLRFAFHYDNSGFSVRALLVLPTGNLFAQTDRPLADHRAAVDEVVDRLAEQIRQHQQRFPHDNVQSANQQDFPETFGPHPQ